MAYVRSGAETGISIGRRGDHRTGDKGHKKQRKCKDRDRIEMGQDLMCLMKCPGFTAPNPQCWATPELSSYVLSLCFNQHLATCLHGAFPQCHIHSMNFYECHRELWEVARILSGLRPELRAFR